MAAKGGGLITMAGITARAAAIKFVFGVAGLCVLTLLPLLSGGASAQSAKPAANAPQVSDTLAKYIPGLQAHLRRLFENAQIRVVQKDKLNADLLIGERRVGSIELDEDDDEAISVSIPIPETEATESKKLNAEKVQAYLRSLLGAPKLQATANKDDGVQVRAGREEIGDVLYYAGEPATLLMVLFADDLPAAVRTSPVASIEPVDSANSAYFARNARVAVRETPSETAPVATELRENQQVKVIGKTHNSRVSEERWYQIEFADGKPRYVLGADLLSQKSHQDKSRYQQLSTRYSRFLEQIGNSQGSLARFMGFYTGGQDCSLRPDPLPSALTGGRLAQRVQDLKWSTRSWALWTDGTHIFRAGVERGEVARFKPTAIRTMKTQNLGEVRFYRLDRLEPPGLDDDLAVTGFADNGKVLIAVELDGNKFKYMPATRCNDVAAVKGALAEFYKNAVANLPTER